jgi:hypothetical protein
MVKNPYRIHFRQGEFELDVEGDRDFVQSYVAAFLAGAPEAPVDAGRKRPPMKPHHPSKEARKAPSPKAAKAPRKAGSFTPDGSALKAFIKGKNPKSSREAYLLFLGFLTSQGEREASDAMIGACFRSLGLAVPPAGRQNFSALRREGLTRRGTARGMWKLTPEGEARLAGAAVAKGPAPKKRKAARKPARKPAAKKRRAAAVAVETQRAAAKKKREKKPAKAKPAAKPGPKTKAKAKPAKPTGSKAKAPRRRAPKPKVAKPVAEAAPSAPVSAPEESAKD